MDSDSESVISGESAVSQQCSALSHCMWNKILVYICSERRHYWRQLLSKDQTEFKIKFKEHFFAKCQEKLLELFMFIETDDTWSKIVALIDDSDKDGEPDEAFLSALDARKYKVLKQIDWNKVKSELNDYTDDEETDREDDTETLD